MPKQFYAFEPGGKKRLQISWKTMWQNTTVTVDGMVLGMFPDVEALRAGQAFNLIDGSTLRVKLGQGVSAAELQVLRDGQPLPAITPDPHARLKSACGILYFIAGVNIILSLAAMVLKIEFWQRIGLGIGSLIFGLIFLALGVFTQRKSNLALILAIVIFALDAVLGVVYAISVHTTLSILSIFSFLLRIILLIPMIQGIDAIKVLKQKAQPGTNLEL